MTAETDPLSASPVSGLVVHARNATAADVADALAAATGVDTPGDPTGLMEVLAEVEDAPRMLVMVDALDEASSATDRIAIHHY